MLYSYIALNAENQKLKGVIAADTSKLAKKKLHQVGLSVISLIEAKEGEKETDLKADADKKKTESFTFYVIDSQGKNLSGNIESSSRKTALKRLAEEYGFEILSLCSTSVPEDIRYKEGLKGLKDLEEDLEDEFDIDFKHSKKGEKEQEKNTDLFDKDFERKRKQILKEVESVSSKTNELIKSHKESIPVDLFDSIESTLGKLSRLRFSNNFNLIQKLIEDLFEKIDEVMKNHIANDNDDDYDLLLEQEKNISDVLSKRGNNKNDILGNLEKFSSSLDMFLGGKKHKKRRRAQKAKKTGVFTDLIEDIDFLRRITNDVIIATFFTKNKALKKERMDEVLKKYKLWTKVKKQRTIASQKRKAERLKVIQFKKISKEAKIFFSFLDELYLFLGATLTILFSIGYIGLILKATNISIPSDFLLTIITSEILPSLSVIVFLLFFTLFLQKKFFVKEVFATLLLFTLMGFFISVYFYNL